MAGPRDASARPWFIDGWTGEAESYGDLARRLASADPAVVSEGTKGMLEHLMRALVGGPPSHEAWEGVRMTNDQCPMTNEDGSGGLGTSRPTTEADAGEVDWRGLWGEPFDAAQGALRGKAAGGFAVELWTSGTSGTRTRVEHSLASLRRGLRVGPRHEGDVWALAYPPNHMAGVLVWAQAVANMNPLVDVTGLGPAEVLAAIERHGVTHLSATPTFYRLLLGVGGVVPAVVSVTVGGEASDEPLFAKLRGLFPRARIHNIYASTEAGTILEASGEAFTVPAELAGRVRVEAGRLWLQRSLCGEMRPEGGNLRPEGGNLRPEGGDRRAEGGDRGAVDGGRRAEGGARRAEGGARQRGEGTLSATKGATSSESQLSSLSFQVSDWFDTGDEVEVLAVDPLCFRFAGRRRDTVNVGGEKVSPAAVEAVLRQHPAVADVLVVGRANSVTGAMLVAEVVVAAKRDLRPEGREGRPEGGGRRAEGGDLGPETGEGSSGVLTEAELRAWLAERLPPHQVPRIIRLVDRLSSTASGKALRR